MKYKIVVVTQMYVTIFYKKAACHIYVCTCVYMATNLLREETKEQDHLNEILFIFQGSFL